MLAAEGELPFPSLWKTKQALNPFPMEPTLQRRSGLPFLRGARPHADASWARSGHSGATHGVPCAPWLPQPCSTGKQCRFVPNFCSEPGKCGRALAAASADGDLTAQSFACPAGLGAGQYPPVVPSLEAGSRFAHLQPALAPCPLCSDPATSSPSPAGRRAAVRLGRQKAAGLSPPSCSGGQDGAAPAAAGTEAPLAAGIVAARARCGGFPPLAGHRFVPGAQEGRGRGQRLLWARKGRLSCSGSGSSASGVGLFMCLWVHWFIFLKLGFVF